MSWDGLNSLSLARQFAAIGARVELADGVPPRRGGSDFDVDVREGRRQSDEIFVLSRRVASISFDVVNVDRSDRHLLLVVRDHERRGSPRYRYLCGHDERAYFAAAVPDARRGITTVWQAKEALKPAEAVASQRRHGVRKKALQRRHNAGFLRQGEWFFIPARELVVPEAMVLRGEPLSRGAGKPHRAEELYRHGGKTIYVCPSYPLGVDETEYRRLLRRSRSLRRLHWQVRRLEPRVYCRGAVRHPDHATLTLRGWHRVLPNTEAQARGVTHLSFID